MLLNLSFSHSPIYSIRVRDAKNTVVMPPTHSFTQKTTTVTYPWPSVVTGLERIALSAQGDLQRVLSAYFARPISVMVVYSHTFWQPIPGAPPEPLELPTQTAIASASPETPIVQKRQVHLQCSGKTICIATSTVRVSSPSSAQLFLVEKYAIGQMFRRLEKMPVFDLLSVGLGPYHPEDNLNTDNSTPGSNEASTYHSGEDRELWRRYKLSVPSFDCDIVEIFPDRQMFVHGEAWLDDRVTVGGRVVNPLYAPRELNLAGISRVSWFPGLVNTVVLFVLGFCLMVAYGSVSFMGMDHCAY